MGSIKMYMLSVDQSTQGTKALIFDRSGRMVVRHDMPHRQIIDENGWVEHDLEEIWENTKEAVRSALKKAGIAPGQIAGMGISNQRETVAAWNRKTGNPIYTGLCGNAPGERRYAAGLKRRDTPA